MRIKALIFIGLSVANCGAYENHALGGWGILNLAAAIITGSRATTLFFSDEDDDDGAGDQ